MKTEIRCDIDMTKAFIAIENGKGGVGKSTLAQLLIEYFLFRLLLPLVIQVDAQARLAELNNFEVSTVASSPELVRADPSLQLSRFAVSTDRAEEGGMSGRPVIVDIGANEDQNFAFWAQQCELDADLEEFGLRPVVFVVFTAEQEAIEKAVEAVESVARALPSAHLILVENQRFGAIEQLHPASSAHRAYAARLAPAASAASYIVMPKIPANSYARFEPHRLSFSRVVRCLPPGLPRSPVCRAPMPKFAVVTWRPSFPPCSTSSTGSSGVAMPRLTEEELAAVMKEGQSARAQKARALATAVRERDYITDDDIRQARYCVANLPNS